MIILLKLAIVPLKGACNNWQERLNFPFFSATLSFLLFCFYPHPYVFPSWTVFSICPPHLRFFPLTHSRFLDHNPFKYLSARGHLPVLLAISPPLSPLSLFHLLPVRASYHCDPHITPLIPLRVACMCILSLHTLLHSLFCFSPCCLPHPSLWGSLSPSSPRSAVPVGLWAGRVWAPAAFSKASAAAPATDPSNTATLTSIYTHIHVSRCQTLRLASSANSPRLYLSGRWVLCWLCVDCSSRFLGKSAFCSPLNSTRMEFDQIWVTCRFLLENTITNIFNWMSHSKSTCVV